VEKWRPGVTKEAMLDELLGRLRRVWRSGPKILNEFSPLMPDTASATLSWRYCETLNFKTIPGVTDLGVFTSLGQPTVQINVDRTRAARYGLTPPGR
jgi:cobalt-zinc-cadmium resistance protein CzcA